MINNRVSVCLISTYWRFSVEFVTTTSQFTPSWINDLVYKPHQRFLNQNLGKKVRPIHESLRYFRQSFENRSTMIKVFRSILSLLCSPNEISAAVTSKSSWISTSSPVKKIVITDHACDHAFDLAWWAVIGGITPVVIPYKIRPLNSWRDERSNKSDHTHDYSVPWLESHSHHPMSKKKIIIKERPIVDFVNAKWWIFRYCYIKSQVFSTVVDICET